MDAIQIEHLNKTYTVGFRMKKKVAVKDLSLTVKEGEIFGFIGPNGAGKTTTIKILTGLNRASSGTAKIFGQDAHKVGPKQDIGFLPERPYFYEYLTASEFLDFYGRLFQMSPAVRQERIKKLLDRVELSSVSGVPLRKFSKGMLQRVGVAQALINDPRLVILDEPMSGLDPLGRMLIRDIILEMKKEGRTLFFSSHILSDVEVICDRVSILVNGDLKAVGTLDELLHTRQQWAEITVRAPVDQVKALVTGLADEVDGFPDRVLIKVGRMDKKREILNHLMAAGIEIDAVTPRGQTLEELFMAEVRNARDRYDGGGV